MSITIEYNGITIATVPDGNIALVPVKDKQMIADILIAVPEIMTQEKVVTENGTIVPDADYVGLSKVVVDVKPTLEEINITKNGEYTPSEGYDGLSKVTVAVEGGTADTWDGTGVEITASNEYGEVLTIDAFTEEANAYGTTAII